MAGEAEKKEITTPPDPKQDGEFSIGEWLKDPGNKAQFIEMAETLVAKPLKKNMDKLKAEKDELKAKYALMEEEIKKLSATPPAGDKKYTPEDFDKAINQKTAELTGKFQEDMKKLQEKSNRINRQLLNNELNGALLKRNCKPESVEIMATFLKSEFSNGKPRISVSDDDGLPRLVVYDENGEERIGKKGRFTLDELADEARERFKDYFLAPSNGGTGLGGGQGSSSNPGRYKVTFDEYVSMNPEQQGKIRPSEVAPRAKK